MRVSCLAFAGMDREPAFVDAVAQLRSMLARSFQPYVRPAAAPSRSGLSQHKAEGAKGASMRLVSEEVDPMRHIRVAMEATHPLSLADVSMPPSLATALDVLVAMGPTALIQWRCSSEQRLWHLVQQLAPISAELVARMPQHVRRICSHLRLGVMAAVADAIEWPDTELVRKHVYGYQVVGSIPDSHVLVPGGQPFREPPDSIFARNAAANNALERRVRSMTPDDTSRAAWRKTLEEVEIGLMAGPFTSQELNQTIRKGGFGYGAWRGSLRFGVAQGTDIRACDDCRPSNLGTETVESVYCARAEFGATVARGLALRLGHGRFILCKSTDDLRKAYRFLPVAHMEYTVICIQDPDTRQACFFVVPGHNFGLLSAVVNFNSFSRFIVEASRSLGAVTVDGYYDDFTVDELVDLRSSGSHWLGNMMDAIGGSFALAKHVPCGVRRTFIGVTTDYSAMLSRGVVLLSIKEERRVALIAEVGALLSARQLSRDGAQRLYGKLYFGLSAHFGRIGKSVLPVLSRHGAPSAPETGWSAELEAALRFLGKLLPVLRPFEVPTLPVRVPPILIYTDGMYEPETHFRREQAAIGFIAWFPTLRRWFHSWLDVSLVCRLFKQAKTHIGRIEALGVLVACRSLLSHSVTAPHMSCAPILSFIDNDGVLHNCVAGSSADPDTSLIIHQLTVSFAECSAVPWYERVPSKANPADAPSRVPFSSEARQEMHLMEAKLHCTFVPSVLPTMYTRG